LGFDILSANKVYLFIIRGEGPQLHALRLASAAI